MARHPSTSVPRPHSVRDTDIMEVIERQARSGPRDDSRPARHRHPARGLLMAPTMLFLLIGVGIEPGWGRFMACVGLLLLGVLTVLAWYDAPRVQRVALKTLYFAGILAYIATLFF